MASPISWPLLPAPPGPPPDRVHPPGERRLREGAGLPAARVSGLADHPVRAPPGQVLREYLDDYNRARPHRALGLRPPKPQPIPDGGVIVRRQRLHGLINEYPRAA